MSAQYQWKFDGFKFFCAETWTLAGLELKRDTYGRKEISKDQEMRIYGMVRKNYSLDALGFPYPLPHTTPIVTKPMWVESKLIS